MNSDPIGEPMTGELPGSDSGRDPRRVDPLSLLAGLLFLTLAAVFAVWELDDARDQLRFVWPVTLLALGGGLLFGARR